MKSTEGSPNASFLNKIKEDLQVNTEPIRKEIIAAAKKSLRLVIKEESAAKKALVDWLNHSANENNMRYSSHLFSESNESVLAVKQVPVSYPSEHKMVDGRIILRDNLKNYLNPIH